MIKYQSLAILPVIFLCLAFSAAGQTTRKPVRGGFTQRPTKPAVPSNTIIYNADSAYEKHQWISPTGDTLPYRLLLPKNYDPAKNYPLLLFLHGAGERGNDNLKQLVHGAQLFLQPQMRDSFPAIVVFPQCDSLSYWSNVNIRTDSKTQKRIFEFQEDGPPTSAMELLLQWLPQLEKQYPSKADQRYVMGLSMGGMGTFELVRRMPKYFAAAVPICGGANPKTAAAIKGTAFWVFHGEKDDVVPYQFSEEMVRAMQEYYETAEMRLTLYANANHNSWDNAFAEPNLIPWIFSQTLHK